jgi:hypothetical protein
MKRVVAALVVIIALCALALLLLGPEAPTPVVEPEPVVEPVEPARVGAPQPLSIEPEPAPLPSSAERLAQTLAAVQPSEELLAMQEALEADPDYHAVCTLEPPLAHATAYLAVGDPAEFNGRRVAVVLGRAFLPILEGGPGAGLLTVEGYAPVNITWEAVHGGTPGACTPDPVLLEPGGTVILGRVSHEGSGDPASSAWVEGCGGLANADEDGVYYMEVVPGPCHVLAMRQDGQLRTIGAPVEVTPLEGKDLVLDLEIPGYRRAGLGVRIRAVDAGFVIEEALAGGGGEAAGLQADDLVLEVDGEPAAGIDLATFVDLVGGREGTDVSLLIERGGEQVVAVVTRLPVN